MAAGVAIERTRRGSIRRAMSISCRFALLLFGALTIGVSIAVMMWNDLGPGPLDVFIIALRAKTAMPLMVAVWLTIGTLIMVAWALGRRPGFGTFFVPVLLGPVIQFTVSALGSYNHSEFVAVQIAVQLLAIGAVGVGAGAAIASGLGMGMGELLTAATADRVGVSEPKVRAAWEVTFVAVGLLMGGPAGVGTLLIACLVGTSVARGKRIVDTVTARAMRQVASVRRFVLSAAV